MTSEVKLKTGGDPRSLPDYAALRDEISKLTHPARPDVDWRYVETLCLRLYEHNGVELQTATTVKAKSIWLNNSTENWGRKELIC